MGYSGTGPGSEERRAIAVVVIIPGSVPGSVCSTSQSFGELNNLIPGSDPGICEVEPCWANVEEDLNLNSRLDFGIERYDEATFRNAQWHTSREKDSAWPARCLFARMVARIGIHSPILTEFSRRFAQNYAVTKMPRAPRSITTGRSWWRGSCRGLPISTFRRSLHSGLL